MESFQVTHCADSSSDIFDDRPQVRTNVTPVSSTLITRYYGVMDDEGADDVFVHPSPLPTTCLIPLLPAEGNPGATPSNTGLTLSDGATDATQAEANPRGLDWHQSEKQLMAARNEPDEVILTTEQPSRESMDNISLSNDKDSTPPTYQEQKSTDCNVCLMEASDEAGKQYEDNTPGDEGSNGEAEDILILSGEESCEDSDTEEEKYPQQKPSNLKEDDTSQDEEESETKHKDICCLDQRNPELSRNNLDRDTEKNATTLPGLSANYGDFQASAPAVICESKQDMIEATTNQPQVADFSAEVTNDNEGQVHSRSLDYTLTKFDWVRRESGSIETQVTQLPNSEDSVNMVERVDGSRTIVTDIQQGEELLQRLQMVQLRHDEIPNKPQEVVKAVRGGQEVGFGDGKVRGRSVAGEDEEEDGRFQDKANTNLMEDNKKECNQVQAKAGTSLLAGPTEHKEITRTEASDSEDDQSDSLIPSALSLNPHETSCTEIPFMHAGNRLSTTETSMEREIHVAAQGKPNLQRADGVSNLADNPDVLEIPFKTNVSLESLLTKACTSQHTQWQFSEKKMQKEISQEIQRELVLVNQGKIPGEYSKGEVRQLKETKLLFEAFQQGNTEGPTRHRKSPVTVVKDQVYPSVLERTRSLERFSLKSSPVSRTHSLKLFNPSTSDRDKSPENFRSKSPTGSTRDKARLSPYSKQDKHLRLHRSMDSINSEASKSALETRSNTTEENKSQGSPILKQNPFFKLRPALALQPEVAKDIREAREREEELRRQRSTLYGEYRQNSEDEEKSRYAQTPKSDFRLQARGKLERVWPPPSKKDQKNSEQTQQEPKVHRAAGQKAPLWQRWECGLINGQAPKEKK